MSPRTSSSGPERAALVSLVTRARRSSDPDAVIDELAGLARAAGAEHVARAARGTDEDAPPPQREAFVMQYEGGMSVEEIADATGVTRETAKSRLRYALAKIRQGLSAWQ